LFMGTAVPDIYPSIPLEVLCYYDVVPK
jgi:hypothetical protein